MQAQLLNQISSVIHDDLLDKDEWLAADIGLAPDVTHSIYSLNFTKITIPWLKLAAKKFVRFQAATRAFSTCRGYIRGFNHFDEYLQTIDGSFISSNINRSHIVGLMQYLTKKGLKPMTRLDWPQKPIIYNSDLPRFCEQI